MNTESIKKMVMSQLGNVKNFASKNSPVLLLAAGISGLLASDILTATATVKAVHKIDAIKYERDTAFLGKKEIVKATWKYYIPVVLTASTGVGCLMFSNKLTNEKNSAVVAAYGASQTMLSNYIKKNKEIGGEENHTKVVKSMAEETVNAEDNHIIVPVGQVLCYDAQTGLLFPSTRNDILQAVNSINSNLLTEMYISYGDFCYELGIEIGLVGDTIGWSVESVPQHDLIRACLDGSGVTKDGQPYMIVDFDIRPSGDFDSKNKW